MPVLAAFILLILAEISLYVTLGSAIGLVATLSEVLVSGLAGVLILRSQGRHMVEKLVDTAMARHNPLRTAGDGMLVALAGIMLILPGFLSDVLGLVLLLPPVRAAILSRIAQRARDRAADLAMKVMLTPHGQRGPVDGGPVDGPFQAAEGDVIDGTATEAPADETSAPRRPGRSGWTRGPGSRSEGD